MELKTDNVEESRLMYLIKLVTGDEITGLGDLKSPFLSQVSAHANGNTKFSNWKSNNLTFFELVKESLHNYILEIEGNPPENEIAMMNDIQEIH